MVARLWRPVRLIATAQNHGGHAAVGRLYGELGFIAHNQGPEFDESAAAEALAAAGLPSDLVDALDYPSHCRRSPSTHAAKRRCQAAGSVLTIHASVASSYPERTSGPGQRSLDRATSSLATVAMSGQRAPAKTASTVVWLTSAVRATSRMDRSPIAWLSRTQNCRAYSAGIGPCRVPVGQSPLIRYSAGGRSPRCLGLMARTYRAALTLSCRPLPVVFM